MEQTAKRLRLRGFQFSNKIKRIKRTLEKPTKQTWGACFLQITHILNESFVSERNILGGKSRRWFTLDASCKPFPFHLVHKVGKMVANFSILSLEVCV